jgi:hypothetical protein
MIVGMVLAGIEVRRHFGAVIDARTPILTLVAAGAAIGVGRLWPTHGIYGGKVGTLLSLCLIGAIYLLFVSPELRPNALRRLRAEVR